MTSPAAMASSAEGHRCAEDDHRAKGSGDVDDANDAEEHRLDGGRHGDPFAAELAGRPGQDGGSGPAERGGSADADARADGRAAETRLAQAPLRQGHPTTGDAGGGSTCHAGHADHDDQARHAADAQARAGDGGTTSVFESGPATKSVAKPRIFSPTTSVFEGAAPQTGAGTAAVGAARVHSRSLDG